MAQKTHIAKQEESVFENAVQQRASDPGSPVSGQYWINTTEKKLKYYDGTAIRVLNIEFLSSDPITPYDGQMWVNTTSSSFKVRSSGVTYTISGGGGGGSLTWSVTAVDVSPAVVENGYITNSASRLNITLPNTAAVGDIIAAVGLGSGGWKITPGSGQNIIDAANIINTTSSIRSLQANAAVELICVVANTTWVVRNIDGVIRSEAAAGYYTAGSSSSTSIQKLLFDTETRTTLGATLDTSREGAYGVSGSQAGFIAGGLATTTISKFIFAAETEANIGATLDTASTEVQGNGVYSSAKGYFLGTGNTTAIEDIDFTSELSVTIAATLPAVKDRAGSCSSSIKGYMGGGGASLSSIVALTFSGESISTIGATLSLGQFQLGGHQSSERGYFEGGQNGSQNQIDRLQFSTETRTTLGTVLTVAKRRMTNFSSSLKGYDPGGNSGGPVDSIGALTYSTELHATISATLAATNDLGTGLQG